MIDSLNDWLMAFTKLTPSISPCMFISTIAMSGLFISNSAKVSFALSQIELISYPRSSRQAAR